MAYEQKWAEDRDKLNETELLKLEKDGLDVTAIKKDALTADQLE